jgi:hypothetical protein
MNLPTIHRKGGLGVRPDWMPDPGVHLYVKHRLEELGIDIDYLPDHWIPLGIVGTMEWVVICGWWLFKNTGIYDTDEPYKWVFDYDGYEFDPDQLLVFREDIEANLFEHRIDNPGINGKERTEALQYLAQDFYAAWVKDKTPAEQREFIPPSGFIEAVMWATFMWVLSDYGKDWIYMKDELFASVYEFGVAFVSAWDNTLLDPNVMICTERPLSSCRYCAREVESYKLQLFDRGSLPEDKVNSKLWCVQGSYINGMWQFTCNNCLVEQVDNGAHMKFPDKDKRILYPHCPHMVGQDGEPGSCNSTCPHSEMSQEKAWERMEEKGSERLNLFREHMRKMGGRTPRQVSGQTVEDIVDYFKKKD